MEQDTMWVVENKEQIFELLMLRLMSFKHKQQLAQLLWREFDYVVEVLKEGNQTNIEQLYK